MCLAVPARIETLLGDDRAVVDLGGVRKEISVALVVDPAVGDYVVTHVGFALHTIDPREAEETLKLLAELAGAERS